MKRLIFVILSLLSVATFAQTSASINKYSLKNGIPVYEKPLATARVTTIYIVVRGTQASVPKGLDGLVDITLDMMTRASTTYSYDDLNQYNHDTQSTFRTYSGDDGALYGFTSLDKYFDGGLARFLSTLTSPSFSEDDFKLLTTETNQELRRQMNDPYSLLFFHINQEFFKNTQYATGTDVTPASFQKITLSTIKDYYATLLNPSKMAVVVAGSYPAQKIIQSLDAAIGNLAPISSQNDAAISPIQPSTSSTPQDDFAPKVYPFDGTKGTAFIARIFCGPPLYTIQGGKAALFQDYPAARIASDIFSDILFNVVRENYGACYTPSAGVTSGAVTYGYEFLYRATDFKHFAKYIKEARKILMGGRVISGRDEDGYKFDSLDERLQGYINSYVNQKYKNQSSTNGVAQRLCAGLLQFNDIGASDALTQKVQTLQPSDVIAAFNKYWVSQKSTWYAVADKSDVGKLRFK